jgi:cytoskeletal protein CcmA (bactofilin family)
MWTKAGSSDSDMPQQPSGNALAAGGRTPDERRTVAWVGKSVIFRGDLISAEDMTIDGRIEGTIEVRDHHLTIGPNASIEADVVAKQVTIFGKVSGSVTGNGKVEIRLGASVEADVACSVLSIQEGAHFSGKVAMQSSRPEADPTDGSEATKKRSAPSAS